MLDHTIVFYLLSSNLVELVTNTNTMRPYCSRDLKVSREKMTGKTAD